ncbi:MAG: helix-turn-helix domain-containing protein, partial [Puniceicoccales bacterium]|nr:helix-turn-helix domain-containing protein [Puniceicoccales bacterium]
KQFIEARTAQGITLEAAAGATKIRAEYLSGIEKGDCNFNLPEIYVRGFVKIYAKYLKLNVNEVIANFPSKEENFTGGKASKKASYGAMIAGEKERDELADGKSGQVPRFLDRVRWWSSGVGGRRLFQVACVVVAALAVFFAFGKSFLHRDKLPEKVPQAQVDRVLGVPAQLSISLVAIGDVKVVVREKLSGDKIFSGNLEAGMVKKISYSRPVQIFYDKGESLWIKRQNGEQLYPQPGRGGVEIK